MNLAGKIFAWLVLIAAGAAMVLTGKSLDVHANYLAKIDKQFGEIENQEQQLRDLRQQLTHVKAEHDREILGWDQYWDRVEVRMDNRNNGTLSISIGSNEGLGQPAGDNRPKPMAFLFQPDGSGGSEYVGAFEVSSIDASQAQLKPAYRLRPGEVDRWKVGAGWRIRTLIPEAYKEQFNNMDVNLTLADELYNAKQRNLDIQKQLIENSRMHLQFRKDELLGSNEMKQRDGQLPVEMVQGLAAGVVFEAERRNALDIEVTDLRHQLKKAYERLTSLMSEIKSMGEKLPGQRAVSDTAQPNATASTAE